MLVKRRRFAASDPKGFCKGGLHVRPPLFTLNTTCDYKMCLLKFLVSLFRV